MHEDLLIILLSYILKIRDNFFLFLKILSKYLFLCNVICDVMHKYIHYNRE